MTLMPGQTKGGGSVPLHIDEQGRIGVAPPTQVELETAWGRVYRVLPARGYGGRPPFLRRMRARIPCWLGLHTRSLLRRDGYLECYCGRRFGRDHLGDLP